MEKRLGLLLAGFIFIFYLTHVISDLPYLAGDRSIHLDRIHWLPYNAATFLRHLTTLGNGFIFVIYSYLILFHFYPAGKIKQIIVWSLVGLPLFYFITQQAFSIIITSPLPIRRRFLFSFEPFYICVYVIYAVIFYFVRYSHYKQLEQKELLLQNRQSELLFLRSQINPHFLFNSLNNIYALVYEKSDLALPTIAGLSDLMRYMLYDSSEKAPIQKEWEYIQKYVALQQLRFAHPIHVQLLTDGSMTDVFLHPLLFIPLVENAFKHGDFSAGSPGFTVSLSNTPGKTIFRCSNKKGKGLKDAGGGIGLNNVKRRLDLLYPMKHIFEIENNEDTFIVTIEISHG